MTNLVVNSNGNPWTLADYIKGLKFQSFRFAKFNPEFEKDLRLFDPTALSPKVISSIRQDLSRLSRISSDSLDPEKDAIALRPSPHQTNQIDWKVYLSRLSESPIQESVLNESRDFQKSMGLRSLGYLGSDMHDYAHRLTGFSPKTVKGEVSQLIFDVYYNHFLRGLLANETLAISLNKPNPSLIKLACAQMSLINDFHVINKQLGLIDSLPKNYRHHYRQEVQDISRERKHLVKILDSLNDFIYNQWSFPNGHDQRLINQKVQDLEDFLKARERRTTNKSHLSNLVSDLSDNWLHMNQTKDVINYSQYLVLKTFSYLSELEPSSRSKTIQEFMNQNGYFNMDLFQKALAIGTPNEKTLLTYKGWQEMQKQNPGLDYNKVLEEALSKSKVKSL